MLSNSNDLHTLTVDNTLRICTKTVTYVKTRTQQRIFGITVWYRYQE